MGHDDAMGSDDVGPLVRGMGDSLDVHDDGLLAPGSPWAGLFGPMALAGWFPDRDRPAAGGVGHGDPQEAVREGRDREGGVRGQEARPDLI